MTKEKNIKVPNLRFPGYEEQWETHKLGDVAEIIGGGTPDTTIEEYWNGDIQWFTPTEIKSNYVSTSERTITKLGLNKSSAKLLPIGTILLTTRATIGEVAIATKECTTNQGFQSLIVNGDANSVFIVNWIKQNRNELIKRANGSTFAEISKSEIEIIPILLPTLAEQQKIASFLSLLDQRIEIQMKIIEKHESLIKGLNDKMLCSRKKTFPRLRYIEFTEEWKYKKIREILKIGNGKDYKHLNKGSIPVFGTGGKLACVDDFLCNGESVCIGRKGTINSPFFYSGKFWTVDTLFYTYSFKNVIPQFCYYLFNRINWMEYNEASGVPSLSKSTIEKISVSIPSIKEQKKIISILSSIDNKVKVEMKVLFIYQKQKAYLLKQMFV